jgi:CHAT domain-containing protein/tetratricopeptide (TPR) repeat protein
MSTLHHGDVAGAEKEAQKGYEQYHGISTEWAWKFTILRGRILYWSGRNDEALQRLAAEPLPPCCGDLAVQKLRLQGVIHSKQHKFQDAENELTEAKRICAGDDYPACGDLNATLGRLEMEREHYASGEQFFERALASARQRGDRFVEASSLLDLSWAAEEQTHFDEALDRANAALEVAVAQGFPDPAEAALGNMAWAYYKLGDVEKAEAKFDEAKKEAERLGDLSDQLKWVLDLGYVHLDNGDISTAEESYQHSLDLARKIKSRDDIINALISLAFVSEQTDKLDDAKRYAGETLAMAREDGHKRDETYGRLVQGRIAAKERDPAAAEAAFHEVAESPDSPVFLKWEAERSLARLYEDENQMDAAGREYRIALNTFESARDKLQHEDTKLPFLTNASGIYDDYIHFLITQGKTDEALQVAEYQRGRTLAEGLGFLNAEVLKKENSPHGTPLTKIPMSRVQNTRDMGHPDSSEKMSAFHPVGIDPQATARHSGGVILFYWLGEKQSYLWAITAQKTKLFSLPMKLAIDPIVQRYRNALADQQEFLPQADADGRALYRMLVAPAASLLKKDARVFIIPDGSLNTLNFETLLAGDATAHYWIEDVAITDANSLRMLASRSARSFTQADSRGRLSPHASSGRLLLLGDAVAASADYPELRKASVEMESIEKHFPAGQQQVLARGQATPMAYLASKPGQFSYIHFVAHGTASRTSPLDSAIVLSSASNQDDSFKLYARDIIQQPLHAELVTISTCYGAGARAYSGEGLVGLSWAFLRTGAHNVIGALWEVSDVSTPQLMDGLYGELMKGKSPDSALRAAKLSLLHSSSAFRKPFYWAPFQLYTGS